MFIAHPLLQLTALAISLYTLQLGISRFRRQHLHHKTSFMWQRHVRFGAVALVMWLIGSVVGLVVVKQNWNGIFITGIHGTRLLVILPLIILSLGSGWYMHKQKKQRTVLPLFHAMINLVLIVLVLFQAFSGWQVYQAFVVG